MLNINPNKHPSYYKIKQGQLVKASIFYRAKTRWSHSHINTIAEFLKNQSTNGPNDQNYLWAHRFNHLDRSLKFFKAMGTPLYVAGAPKLRPDIGSIQRKAMKNIPLNQHPHVQEKRFPKKHKVYHYNKEDTHVNHAFEGFNIFLSTQKERFLSMIGKKIQSGKIIQPKSFAI